jgi:hypothetical protein
MDPLFDHEKTRQREPLRASQYGRRNGKRQGRQRVKFFDDARGSALECAACLDAAVAKRLVSADRVCSGKQMLARVVAMLSRLIDRFNR